jgi:LacI family transcriptional regulator
MRKRPPTIEDVARQAEVSVSTASRVVRNHPDVRDATRQRVSEVISELGYRPSLIARALLAGETRTIGLLMSDISNPFYPEIAKHLEGAAQRRGYGLLICNTGDQIKDARKCVQRLMSHAVDGIIHASVGTDEDAVLTAIGDPSRIVFVNRRPQSDQCSYVVTDGDKAAVLLTRHLLDLGHRRIGFISGPDYVWNVRERLRGFLETLPTDADPVIVDGDFSAESGARAVESWIRTSSLPSAIIGSTDTVAVGVLGALRDADIRVPADIAVAGFGNSMLASSSVVSLTTVAQDVESMAGRAVRQLLKQIQVGSRPRPVHDVLEPKLIVRSTTAPVSSAVPAQSV